MGGPDATPDLWKHPFSAVMASGGYPGNVQQIRDLIKDVIDFGKIPTEWEERIVSLYT